MTLNATITVPKSATLVALFTTEAECFRHKRAGYRMREEGRRLILEIEAADASALKATVSSICRTLAVYEKAR